MGAHHVAARVTFDHGADVAAVIVARGVVTAITAGALVFTNRISWTLTRRQWGVMTLAGILVWLQSSLVSATAHIPGTLALPSFSTDPIWTTLFVWALYRRRPDRAALLFMHVIIFGLTLALDLPSAIGGKASGRNGGHRCVRGIRSGSGGDLWRCVLADSA